MSVSCGGTGQQWSAAGAGAPGAADLGMAQALLGVTINPTIEPPELTQTLGGHKQNLMHIRTPEKGAVTPQETAPDLPICVQVSLAAGLGALSVAVHAWDLLKEVTIIFITSTIVGPR